MNTMHSYKRLRVLFYSCRGHELSTLTSGCPPEIEATFSEERLGSGTAHLAQGFDAVCLFTSDDCSAQVIQKLSGFGVRYIALRSAGYDHTDLAAAAHAGIKVCHVPAYSPGAVAEHAVLLALALLRKLALAAQQVHAQNFSLNHLVGRELGGLTVGVVGTGHIGSAFARILSGFGSTVLAYDLNPNSRLEAATGLQYTDLDTVLHYSDLISLHLPLSPASQHLINEETLKGMKPGALLINTARGGLVDTAALLVSLRNGQIGGFGADVYEHEKGIFFNDLTGACLDDTELAQLLGMPQVILTPHQGFATEKALTQIAQATYNSLQAWRQGKESDHELAVSKLREV